MAKIRVYVGQNLDKGIKLISGEAIEKKTVIIIGNCRIQYEGRGVSRLDWGERIIMIKSDGSLLVHRPFGYLPVNWQPETSTIHIFSRGEYLCVKAVRSKPRERVFIELKDIDMIVVSELEDNAQFIEYLSEAEIRDFLASHPEIIEKGLRTISVEKNIEPGFIDLYCVDEKDRIVVVEIKRHTATVNAVKQLSTYINALRREYGPNRNIRGILVAPSITKNAHELLVKLGMEYRRIDLKAIYEKIGRTIVRDKSKSILEYIE